MNPSEPEICLVSRPGKRVWVAQCEQAKVLTTLNFKASFSREPKMLCESSTQWSKVISSSGIGSAVHLNLLKPFGDYILAFDEVRGLF